MMFNGFVGLTATNGSSSLFTQLTSPGNKNAETSHDPNGLVLDAWLTDVVVYGPADATATGRRINSAETAAAALGKPFLMAHLHQIAPMTAKASILLRRATRCQASTSVQLDRAAPEIEPTIGGRRSAAGTQTQLGRARHRGRR